MLSTREWRVTCPTTPGTPMTSFCTVRRVRDNETREWCMTSPAIVLGKFIRVGVP